ncbi:MAG: hypothetical protein JO316_21460 [Abitibacteriaceae bacterium]|nr:hypothetical protein [Abditibacteriaceae bacterium]MBV9867931.1 hypothetical protein [Abditibacteriaceae bacterium]
MVSESSTAAGFSPDAPHISNGQPIRSPWWGRISLLWLMCVPIIVAMYSLCIGIVPHDFWWHARAGGIVATTGQVPNLNIFTTVPEAGVTPHTLYVYQSWIAEFLFYETMYHGGLAWIIVLRSFCIVAAFVLITGVSYARALNIARTLIENLPAARQGGVSPAIIFFALETPLARLVALGGLLSLVMMAPNMEVRPQFFSVPLFAIFIAALLEWPRLSASPRSLLPLMVALILLMLLWANLHGAFCTGLIMVVTYFGGELLYTLWPMPARRKTYWGGTPLSFKALAALGLLLLLCVLVAMVNPQGVGIYAYVMRLAGNPTGQKYFLEWQSPTWGNAIHDVFFISPLILAFMAYRILCPAQDTEQDCKSEETMEPSSPWGHFGVRPAEVLVLAALAVMTLRDVRSLAWYSLFYPPLFSAFGTTALVKLKTKQWLSAGNSVPPTAPLNPGLHVINAVMAVFLLLLVVPSLPWVKPYIPLPDAFQARFAPTPKGQFPLGFSSDPPLVLDRLNPVEAVDYLRQHPPRKRLFTEIGYGSYIIWMLCPQISPSADTRVELYPTDFWEDYFRLARGPANAAQILAERGFSDALLDDKQQPALIKRLKASPGWHVVFRKGPSVLLHHAP